MKTFIRLICIIAIPSINFLQAQSLYETSSVQKIEISFAFDNWDYRLDTAKMGADGYTIAGIKINGTTFDSVGVKYKGNSSFDSTFKKNPWNIELDHVKDYTYDGYSKLKLANIYSDPSMVREAVAYNILKNYMACPKANYAEVYVNDVYIGLYTNTETINKAFCNSRFGSKSNTFFECSPTVVTTPTVKGSFRYLSADSSAYFSAYELKSNNGWGDLLALCNAVTNAPATLPELMYIDEAIWMLAFDNVMLNLDSYIGVFAQNHYIYKDASGLFHPIIWDLNMSFGGFQHTGMGNTGMGTLPLASLPNLSLTLHEGDQYWPLINVILHNPQYRRMYIAHAKTIYNEFLANEAYKTMASEFKTLIDPYVMADTNAFFSYDQFLNGMDTGYTFESLTIPGFGSVMDARASYLQSTSEFTAIQPEISNINTFISDDELYITVSASNANNVILGYKKNNTIGEFTKIQLYDDGDHGDEDVEDGIFGVSIPGYTDLGSIVYYIYAENDNAGRFSPERAQYEFYTYEVSNDDDADLYWINDDFSTHSTENDYIDSVVSRPTLPNSIGLSSFYTNIESQGGTCGAGNGLRIRGLGDAGYVEFTVPNTGGTSLVVKAKSSSADRMINIYKNDSLQITVQGLDENNCYEYIDSVKSTIPVTYRITGGKAGDTKPVVISSILVEKYRTVRIATQPQGGVYGSVPQLTVEATGEGTLSYQWYKSGELLENAVASSFSPGGVGSYYVIVKDDYDSLKSKTVSITRAPLTVTVEDDTVEKGFDPDSYTGTYTIAGFVNNEDESVVNTSPVVKIASTITSASPAGTYPDALEAIGAKANNYKFSYTFGTLTIQDSGSGITDLAPNGGITIYPNPAQESISVKYNTGSSNREIRIYTITGSCIYSQAIGGENETVIDIRTFPSSVYIVQLTSDEGVFLHKFIKQ